MNQEVKIINGYKVKDEKAIRTYDTVSDMKNDTKLSEGQHVKTRGYYSVNDGGSAEYIIKSNVTLDEYKEDLNNGLYANLIINDEVVTYRHFGAKLDGTNDDTNAIIKAHEYANLHNLKVVQNSGTLYIPSADINNCPIINTDCDLTGLKIKFDENSDSKTVMIIADPETLTNSKNDIQHINLTSEDIAELYKSNTDSINFLEDYKNHYVVFETDMKMGKRTSGYHEDIYYSQGFEVNDLQQLQPNNMYSDISENANEVEMKYLPLSQKHITIKLPQINIYGDTTNNPMILVMRNNIDLLDCIITKTNYTNTTEWEQPLFRCRYCCNITVKNWVGENVSSEPSETDITSYIIAFDKCFNVLYENNNLLKAHGCFVSYHTNFINFINNVCDRFDNHYGLFGNINITNNSFMSYPSRINLGYGNGQVNIENCSFYKYDENGKTSDICIDNRTDLAVMYAGNINVNNVYIKGINLTGVNRYVTLLQWIPTKDENTTFPSYGNYHIPNLNIKNVRFDVGETYYRTLNIHNNNVEDVDYILGTFNIDSDQARPYTSVVDFTQINTDSDCKIVLNGERIQLICGTATIPVYLKDNNTFRSQDINTHVSCYITGDNNVIRGTYENLTNKGHNTSNNTINVTSNFRNSGRLYISDSLTTSNLESTGTLTGEDIILTNGYINGILKIKKLTVGTLLGIVGSYVEISTSVTNSGQIYLTGNYMYSSVAGRFNNGTINGNGNWAGDNSNVINTL
jgi:hypothetical protein